MTEDNMSISTGAFFDLAGDKPLFSTPLSAFLGRSNVFRHYKGGLYSVIGTIFDTDEEEIKVAYEHLWPHKHRLFSRSIPIFFGDATPIEYKYAGPRFWFLRDDGALLRKIFHQVIRPVHTANILDTSGKPAYLEQMLAYKEPEKTADYV